MPQISNEEYCVRMGEEFKTGAFWRDGVAECFATFLFVTSTLFITSGITEAGPDQNVQIAVGLAFAWTALGYGLGDFGGAHMNNAITFACLIRREISFLKALIFWIMQAAGAIAAGFFFYAVIPGDKKCDLGNTEPADDIEWWQAMVIELFVTFIVCITFLATFSVERKGYIIMSSLPVGFAIGLGAFISLASTGASMNSMRSLGPAVVTSVMDGCDDVWGTHWIYWAGPMGGALLAGIMYWIFDSVDSTENANPYYMQSGTWQYNTGGNGPVKRPQVMPASSAMGNQRDVLNNPSQGNGLYHINGVATKTASNNGFVSAYSSPPMGSDWLIETY